MTKTEMLVEFSIMGLSMVLAVGIFYQGAMAIFMEFM